MKTPNFMKIFIGLLTIYFMIAIFWTTSWQMKLKELDETEKKIVQLNFEINHINKQKEEIPKLSATIAGLTLNLSETKAYMIANIADTEKLVKEHKKRLQDYKKSIKEK